MDTGESGFDFGGSGNDLFCGTGRFNGLGRNPTQDSAMKNRVLMADLLKRHGVTDKSLELALFRHLEDRISELSLAGQRLAVLDRLGRFVMVRDAEGVTIISQTHPVSVHKLDTLASAIDCIAAVLATGEAAENGV